MCSIDSRTTDTGARWAAGLLAFAAACLAAGAAAAHGGHPEAAEPASHLAWHILIVVGPAALAGVALWRLLKRRR